MVFAMVAPTRPAVCMPLNILSKFNLKCFLIILHVVVYSAIIGRSTKDFKKYLLNFMRVMPVVSLSFDMNLL